MKTIITVILTLAAVAFGFYYFSDYTIVKNDANNNVSTTIKKMNTKNVEKCEYEGHSYLIYKDGFTVSGICHDANCKCNVNEVKR